MDTFQTSAEENTLVHRLKAGDKEAYAELYDRYGRSLYGVIFTIVKNVPDSENLLQDVFVKIWRNIDRYDPEKGRLFTWLIVIARRMALDFVRSAQFGAKQMIQSETLLVHKASNSNELNRLDNIGLDKIIDNLSPQHKEVIDLQYFMGYTQQEVADELGLPLGTVKSRTRAALSALRQILSIES